MYKAYMIPLQPNDMGQDINHGQKLLRLLNVNQKDLYLVILDVEMVKIGWHVWNYVVVII